MKRIGILLCVILLLAACGKVDEEIAQITEPEPEPPAPPPESPIEEPVVISGDVLETSTQTAEDLVRTFALGSGWGQNATLSEKTRGKVLSAAGVTHPPKSGEAISKRVYAAGDPKLKVRNNAIIYPTNWETWRWRTEGIDQSSSLTTMANTIIAEVLAADVLTGRVDPGEDYDGVLLGAAAAEQAKFIVYNAKSGQIFGDVAADGSVNPVFDYHAHLRLLEAYSRLAHFADEKGYAGDMKKDQAIGYANQIFNQLITYRKREEDAYLKLNARELQDTLQAYTLFASVTDSYKWRLLAVQHIDAVAALLKGKVGTGGKVQNDGLPQAQAQAGAVVGLTYAYKATGNEEYMDFAKDALEYLKTLWNEQAGVFGPEQGAATFTYTAQDIAQFFHALNAVHHVLELEENERYTKMFQSTVVDSGLLQSEYRDLFPEVEQSIDTLLSPTIVAKIQYNGQWQVVDEQFKTGDAMALASALLLYSEDAGGAWKIREFGFPEKIELEE